MHLDRSSGPDQESTSDDYKNVASTNEFQSESKIRLLAPKRRVHILPRIEFQFNYDELKQFREIKNLHVNYGGKLNIGRFHRDNQVLLPYQKI